MTPDSKLYVIARTALSSGLKAAQLCHAARAFASFYPDLEKSWFEVSNNIVLLEHDNIEDLADRLERHGLALSRFHEPDLDGQFTSFCVEPEAKRHVARLPLAFSAPA
jgi:hypothetical protein